MDTNEEAKLLLKEKGFQEVGANHLMIRVLWCSFVVLL